LIQLEIRQEGGDIALNFQTHGINFLKPNVALIAERCDKTSLAHPVLSSQQDVPRSTAGASKVVGEGL
jgi:hypothetical protein